MNTAPYTVDVPVSVLITMVKVITITFEKKRRSFKKKKKTIIIIINVIFQHVYSTSYAAFSTLNAFIVWFLNGRIFFKYILQIVYITFHFHPKRVLVLNRFKIDYGRFTLTRVRYQPNEYVYMYMYTVIGAMSLQTRIFSHYLKSKTRLLVNIN